MDLRSEIREVTPPQHFVAEEALVWLHATRFYAAARSRAGWTDLAGFLGIGERRSRLGGSCQLKGVPSFRLHAPVPYPLRLRIRGHVGANSLIPISVNANSQVSLSRPVASLQPVSVNLNIYLNMASEALDSTSKAPHQIHPCH